ncbi:polyisoprenyl-teichoic acid--peptidoglycan teichoic acid transferase TagU [Peribacillus deserti]|uniref:Polyisoprenyl-teichoic acid--peptidoglycan teichoic acid transferase TagU n=1 Tax=Peribacillus deserti TaxID=673318 RepID=A0A2N5MBT6_9BACI|nr:LytR family transcriptional regulator [Peribacillus deserti]PLT31829.1 LytR family transcriptional regulator [Peribacillus deserti]
MKKKIKRRRWGKYALIALLLLAIGGGTYLYLFTKSLTNAVNTMHQPLDRNVSAKRTEAVTLEKRDPFSVLLLGVDKREHDTGRSDTIIVLTVNPNKNSIEMLSIPRDTRTIIAGKGTEDKINHAYAFGGVEMAINTVEHFLDIPIDYYVQVNMEGFKDIIDAVGGITVDNDLDFTAGGVHFAKGSVTLNGADALKYSRMRYDDPRGDFGRQLRQRQILEGIMKEGASVSSLTSFDEIFTSLGNNVKTNLTFDQMIDLQKNYKGVQNQIVQNQIKGTGTKIDGIYYYLVPEAEKLALHNLLKEHLEL